MTKEELFKKHKTGYYDGDLGMNDVIEEYDFYLALDEYLKSNTIDVKDLKRYRLQGLAVGDVNDYEDLEGDWVKFKDVEKLLQLDYRSRLLEVLETTGVLTREDVELCFEYAKLEKVLKPKITFDAANQIEQTAYQKGYEAGKQDLTVAYMYGREQGLSEIDKLYLEFGKLTYRLAYEDEKRSNTLSDIDTTVLFDLDQQCLVKYEQIKELEAKNV